MLKKRLIPAIDVIHDQAAKYVQFRNPTIIGDPAQLGKQYAEGGADELVYLDTTASLRREGVKYDWIRRVAAEISIPFSVIGGVRSVEDMKQILRAGADKVGINSSAVNRPKLLSEAAHQFGRQCVVLGLDAKAIYNQYGKITSWEVMTHSAHQRTGLDAIEWAQTAEELGAGEIICTSIDQDGMKQGYDLQLMKALTDHVSIPVIASGGAGGLDDIAEVFMKGKVEAALVASILHYQETTISEIKNYLAAKKIPIRQRMFN